MVTRDALYAGLGACLLLGALGCTEAGPLSDDEMQRLKAFQLQPLPADPSNTQGDNPKAAQLGKQLFFDRRFSGPLGPYNSAGVNGSRGPAGASGLVSCADCHDPAAGGIDHRSLPAATSLGAGYTPRNSPSVINAAYSPLWQFWDGRKDSLWSQALSPPEGAPEQNSSRLAVVHFLAANYAQPYADVFGPLPDLSDPSRFPATGKPGDPSWDVMTSPADQATVNGVYANFGKAIAAYERLLTSPNFQPSQFDQFMAGDKEAMSPAAIRGARLFIGHAGCAECHSGPMFTDYKFHNIGAPQTGQYVPTSDDGRRDVVKGIKDDPFNRNGAFSESKTDAHYAAFASLSDDQLADLDGLFKTPSLRNVSKTAPYMHDGVYADLWAVVNHYNFGGESGNYAGEKDPAISPLLLSDGDLDDLVEFLQALEDGPALDMTLTAAP
jgi:cytochrome c peroxidase